MTSREDAISSSELESQAKQNFFMSASLAAVLMLAPQAGVAVSGGGLDFANMDLSGQDFSNTAQHKGKDFTQVIAKGTNFASSNLQGCRFFKAYLVSCSRKKFQKKTLDLCRCARVVTAICKSFRMATITASSRWRKINFGSCMVLNIFCRKTIMLVDT
jgi:uncharacterized protein YjbI with pentapeptide repeats